MSTDNRQETGLLGWLAGIVDGEGTISLTVSQRLGRGKTIRTDPKVIIGNTDPGIINRCCEVLKMIGVGHYQRHERRPGAMVIGTFVKKFKPMTVIEVTGLKRVRTLLTAISPYLAGEKATRAELLMKFIAGRIGLAEASMTAQNISYRQEDVDNVLAFLALTRSKNIEHVTRLLNEHTRETRRGARRTYKRQYNLANRELQNAQRRERRKVKMCSGLTGDRES